MPCFPGTVAVPSDEKASARAAWLRSGVDLMWSQSSSLLPRLVPFACPELLLGSPVAFEPKLSIDTSVVFDETNRKIGAGEGEMTCARA